MSDKELMERLEQTNYVALFGKDGELRRSLRQYHKFGTALRYSFFDEKQNPATV